MLDALFTLIVVVVLVGCAIWIVKALVKAFEIPEPIVTLIYIVLVLVVLFGLVRMLGVNTHHYLRF